MLTLVCEVYSSYFKISIDLELRPREVQAHPLGRMLIVAQSVSETNFKGDRRGKSVHSTTFRRIGMRLEKSEDF